MKPYLILMTLVAFLMGMGFSSNAHAQAQQDLPKPNQNLQGFSPPGEIPSLKDILKNIHGSYAVSFMGPQFNGNPGETYNIYLPDVSSTQLYHSFRIGYQVSEGLQMGIGEDIVHNLHDGTVAATGHTYQHSFEWYDPYLYFNLPNLIQVPGWLVFTSGSFSLPVTKPTQDAAKITNIVISQSWSVANFPSPFRYGFRLYLNPQFYNDPLPSGFTDRQTLYFSFGHFWGYQFSPLWGVSTSTHFDVEHRSPTPKGLLNLGSSLPDYFQVSTTVSPNVFPMFISIGAYMQCLIWKPAADTAIVGANFSVGF